MSINKLSQWDFYIKQRLSLLTPLKHHHCQQKCLQIQMNFSQLHGEVTDLNPWKKKNVILV